MNPWKLIYNKFDPEKESLRETLCTLGNGYFGTRGAVAETPVSKVHYPGTYIAGVYNALDTDIASRTISNEDFVNCPNWLLLNYRINDGPWFDRSKVKILSWKRELNMRKGILLSRLRWKDEEGNITLVENCRMVSMSNPHCGGLRCTFTPENYNGQLTIRSGIDGLILNGGVERYRQLNNKHLQPSLYGIFGEDGIYLQMQTVQSKIKISEALRTLVYRGHERISPKLSVITHGRQRIIHECKIEVEKGHRYSIEKLVSIYTSRDQGVLDSSTAAQETAGQLENFESLLLPHQGKWKALWKRFDMEVQGDPFVQQVLRLHIFHLLQSASTYNEDIDAGMPVRGLHGEAYRGHIFWDELYVFPFYNLHAPETTRALLMYRYRRLMAAKENAKQNGFKGAMYPWQTASTGEETTQVIHINPISGTWGPDYSSLQRHVSLAVAYNVWNYYYLSGDRDFMDRYGAEMIIEISHFWSSIAKWNPKTERYDIDGVMGPDEFHEKYPAANRGGLKNNAYSNVMAVWVFKKALYILEEMMNAEDKNALLLKCEISETEVERWKDIVTKIAIPMDKSGLIHQFEGYMDLEELNWEEYRQKYENIHRIDRILKAEGLSPDSFKVAKQADVLMLFYVLNKDEVKDIFKKAGYPYSKNLLKKNFEYYFPRTSHGSTLSMAVHAYLAEMLNKKEEALGYFMETLKSDIFDTQGGTTQEGIHAGVMGASLDLFLRNYAGLSVLDDRISLNPKLPDKWESVKFSVRFKNIWFSIKINKDNLSILAEPLQETGFQANSKIPIEIRKKIHHILPGKPYNISTRTLFLI